jgi:hypothetical protein
MLDFGGTFPPKKTGPPCVFESHPLRPNIEKAECRPTGMHPILVVEFTLLAERVGFEPTVD